MAREYHVALDITMDDDRLDRQLAALEIALSPAGMGAFMGTTYTPYIKRRIAARFASEGDDVSGAWFPLSELSQQTRASQGFGSAHPINVRTGEMERYLMTGAAGIVPDSLGVSWVYPGTEPSGDDMMSKLMVAQQGGEYGDDPKYENAPARPVLGFNEKDLLFFLQATSTFLEESIRRA